MNDDDVSFQHHEHTKEGRAAARQSMGDPSSAAPTAAVGSKRLAQEHLVQVVATRVTNAAAGQFGYTWEMYFATDRYVVCRARHRHVND